MPDVYLPFVSKDHEPPKRIVIDPLTRIEGHLRIEAELSNGLVQEAWSASTMFRGIERILVDRDPREAWIFAQRICGVCTTVHALASVRAVENALGIVIPDNARLIRALIGAAQLVQDHVMHFYHLHALDWVDVLNALNADPATTSALAASMSSWPQNSPGYFTGVRDRLQNMVDSGQLGLFANGYWGHPAYALAPEENLLAVAHYLEALDLQRSFIQVHAILGGKNPHPQSYLVGGVSVPMDPGGSGGITPARIAELEALVIQAQTFVNEVYLPDVLMIAAKYPDWVNVGGGVGNFMSYGDYPMDNFGAPAANWLPGGLVWAKDLTQAPQSLDASLIREYVTRSWYSYSGGDALPLHPLDGETEPNYTGPQPPYDFLNTDGKYSWLKSPRYMDEVIEVGPLARIAVGYAAGQPEITAVVNQVLGALGWGTGALFSTMGRIAARAIETQVVANQLSNWVAGLFDNLTNGNLNFHEGTLWDPATWPSQVMGYGTTEAPRGGLGHWIRIEDGKISNYQAVVPTTWNGSPRDANDRRGPFEAALIGTPVADETQPLEILRTIHSFDPCMACSVHIVDLKADPGASHGTTIRVAGCD